MRLLWFAVGVLALFGCGVTRMTLPDEHDQPREVKPVDNSLLPVAGESPNAVSEPDTLTLAAESLERGDQATAAVHLEKYVCRHPEQVMFRWQLAEMLVRVGHDDTAKVHYERFLDDAASATGPARTYFITAHTRLMELAQRQDDQFAELFHRGVGLFLLAKEQDKLTDRDPAFGEELLCKAMKALVEAKELHPSDARVHAYLAEVYESQGNPRAAEAERGVVRAAFMPAPLISDGQQKCLLAGSVGR